MARFQPAINADIYSIDALALKGKIIRGQTVNNSGTRGRYVGNRYGIVWIYWGKCSKEFVKMCEAFDTQVIR